jgi:hypothetical protein
MQNVGIAFTLFLGNNVDDSCSVEFCFYTLFYPKYFWLSQAQEGKLFSPPLSIVMGKFFISTLLLTFFHFLSASISQAETLFFLSEANRWRFKH